MEKGINYQLVINSPHFANEQTASTNHQRVASDILVAHGFPEHIIGRSAGKNNVPHMVQVEHNLKNAIPLSNYGKPVT